ncbi:MAG: TraB/GumN family protein [Clostridia bacterium]|nr:TraB/GumN family protein [Clostridia bacterium]
MLCAYPAVAAEETETQVQPLPVWSYDSLSDIAALGMWSDAYYYCNLDPVTEELLTGITAAVADKLALLGVPAREPNMEEKGLVTDLSKGGVMNRLYLELASYRFDFLDAGENAGVLFDLGIVKGDGTGSENYSKPCTLIEALVMARRLILAAYDACDAGSRGLLWKVASGNTTLYLLGTVHVDRGNIYPFHKSLRGAIEASQNVMFEVDFGDAEGAAAFAAMQVYSDGTTLKDHVSPALYTKAIKVGAELGMTEEQTASIKAWALANSFQALALNSESASETPMAMDMYVYSKAMNAEKTIGQAESFQFQGELFDSLSSEYQESYLADCIDVYYGDTAVGDTAAVGQIDVMLAAWKDRDVMAFAKAMGDKDEMLKTADELNAKLYLGRDPGMIAYADSYLKGDEAKTGILVVGAGHMMGGTGIVQGLKNLGYSVELAAG